MSKDMLALAGEIGPYFTRFNERELTHILFCRNYADHYAHGAPGNLDMLVVARLSNALKDASFELGELVPRVKAQEKEIEELKEYKWMYEGLKK